MIIKLYKNPKYGFPLVSFILLITCAIVTLPTAFQNDLYHIFALQSKPFFFWQTFSGVFEHSIFPNWFIWPHFLGNISVIFIFGVIIERLIGSNKMLLLTLFGAASNILFFYICYWGQYTSGSGVSGIVYTYAPIAIFILWQYIKKAKYNYEKDFLLYFLVLEFAFIWGFITAMSSWDGTNIYHFVATIVGIIFLIVFKKQIAKEIDFMISMDENTQIKQKSKWIYLTTAIPLFMIIILFLYQIGNLDGMFVSPISISTHATIQDVVKSNNTIEIIFEKPVTKFNSVYTSGNDTSKITYSEDRKTLYCTFENGIHFPYEIELRSAYSIDGQIVKDISIKINE